jgi:hypothetical protein
MSIRYGTSQRNSVLAVGRHTRCCPKRLATPRESSSMAAIGSLPAVSMKAQTAERAADGDSAPTAADIVIP